MINKVILIGNVGADPEIRTLESGVKMARIRVATTERIYNREAQESRDHTEWHSVVLWRNLADVADRFIKENVIVHPTRGNIISADGKLMASSLPEYKIYMDFKAGGETKDTMLMNHLTEICEGLHQIFPDKSAKEFRQHILKVRTKQKMQEKRLKNKRFR